MSMYYKRNGEAEWCPTCTHEKDGTPTINPGSRNQENQFNGTVESAKRLWEWFQKGILSLEDFNYGIDKNSEHIGITKENLLEHVGISSDQAKELGIEIIEEEEISPEFRVN